MRGLSAISDMWLFHAEQCCEGAPRKTAQELSH
jgi:hypothetical protein